jgi:hypothetical protein
MLSGAGRESRDTGAKTKTNRGMPGFVFVYPICTYRNGLGITRPNVKAEKKDAG